MKPRFDQSRVREVMQQQGLPHTEAGYRAACSILGQLSGRARRARKLRADWKRRNEEAFRQMHTQRRDIYD